MSESPIPDPWTAERLRILRAKFGSTDDVALARSIKIPVAIVRAKAAELALAKNKKAFPGQKKMPKWEPWEVDYLEKSYPSISTLEVAKKLGRSVKAVTSKAGQLGVRKTQARMSEMGRANVSRRPDRTTEPQPAE